MKKRYQIEKQRAVNEFRHLATNENPMFSRTTRQRQHSTIRANC